MEPSLFLQSTESVKASTFWLLCHFDAGKSRP